MRRLILSLAAAAAVAAPLALSATPASADPKWERGGRSEGRGHREHRQERWERRDDRREFRSERWDGPPGRGWDRGRHNGYYYRNRWHYGPPPAGYYRDPGYRPGYAAWRRGAYLPPVYRGYVVEDYYRYRLRPPPRGYVWYRVGDDYLLTAIGSGLIFDIIED